MNNECKDCKHENKCACYVCSRTERKDLFEAKEVEIRPEKGGELWRYNNRFNWLTYIELGTECLRIQCEDGTDNLAEILSNAIHNKNGWTRALPKVEDDSVERIEIEGVKWYENSDGCITPEINSNIANSLLNKPPMKMILEYEKGSHECQG